MKKKKHNWSIYYVDANETEVILMNKILNSNYRLKKRTG